MDLVKDTVNPLRLEDLYKLPDGVEEIINLSRRRVEEVWIMTLLISYQRNW
jgi:hypothetical protein